MTIKEHDSVVLTADLPSEQLKAGDVGAVVHLRNAGAAYEVEFMTFAGNTVAVATVNAAARCGPLANVISVTCVSCNQLSTSSPALRAR